MNIYTAYITGKMSGAKDSSSDSDEVPQASPFSCEIASELREFKNYKRSLAQKEDIIKLTDALRESEQMVIEQKATLDIKKNTPANVEKDIHPWAAIYPTVQIKKDQSTDVAGLSKSSEENQELRHQVKEMKKTIADLNEKLQVMAKMANITACADNETIRILESKCGKCPQCPHCSH